MKEYTLGQKITLTLYLVRLKQYEGRVIEYYKLWQIGKDQNIDLRILAEIERFENRNLSKADEIEALLAWGHVFKLIPPELPSFINSIADLFEDATA